MNSNPQVIKIKMSWLFVTVPLLWGVVQVIIKTMAIFM